MIQLQVERTDTNVPLLHQQIKAALAEKFLGLQGYEDRIVALLTDEATDADQLAVTSLIEQHDGAGQSADQIIRNAAREAGDTLRSQLVSRIEWHEANPVTAGNAVEVARRMQQEWVFFLKKLRAEL